VLGAVDEANAVLGVVRSDPVPAELAVALASIQNDLFDLGADLASVGMPGRAPRLVAAHVERLEQVAAAANRELSPLTSFVLPGGSRAAAALHLARTVVRRAERAWCAAHATPDGSDLDRCGQLYLNRLSDLCFILARRSNAAGSGDVLWVPGGQGSVPGGGQGPAL